MKASRRLLLKSICVAGIVAASAVMPLAAGSALLKDTYKVAKISDQMSNEDLLEGSYYRALRSYEGIAAAQDGIVLSARSAARDDGKDPLTGIYEAEGGISREALLWTDSAPSYTWRVTVPEEGLYRIRFSYVPIEERLDIIYGIRIDGEYPFKESESLRLLNEFQPAGAPAENGFGDQYPIELKHVGRWKEYDAYDLDGIFTSPLLFHLNKGIHAVSMIYKSGDIALSSVALLPAEEFPDYAKYSGLTDYPEYTGAPIRLQAEDASFRSRRILTSEADNDPSVVPYRIGKRTQNVLNGWNYRQGNDEVSWIIDVPQDGRYKFFLRVWQNYFPGNVVYRQVLVDGKVPFKEADAMRFEGTGQNFRVVTFGAASPYLLSLGKGRHTITLRAVMGELTDTYYALLQLSYILNGALLDIQTITGSRPDPNFNYRIEVKAPWVIKKLQEVRDGIDVNAGQLFTYGGKTSEMITAMRSATGDLSDILDKPRNITRKISTLSTIQGQLGSWISTLRDTPLMMDYMELLAADAKPEIPQVTLTTRVKVLFAEFFNSFRKADNIGNVDRQDEQVIEIWTAREREYGEIMQRTADEKFTPLTGIRVKVNILGAGSVGVVNTASPLTLALVSGDTPDVVLGSDSISPVELAIRKSSFDISEFSDFEEIRQRFPEGAVIPFEYKGGTYALPDTMDFSLLFYRKDILNSIGIKVPDTWEELTAQTLPALQQYSLNFTINNSSNRNSVAASDALFQFMMLYTQRGGRLYKDNSLDSTLDSDLAYQCFRQYTELYTRYNIAYGQNFYNQFSVGRIPLAIGGLYDYMQLDVAAPGIYGKWGIAPVPGNKGPDGVIDRSVCGTVTSSMLFDGNGKADQGWAFLKWWTSEDIQIGFAQELESSIGPQARWYSASSQAILALGWSEESKKTIREMLGWYTNVPNILGGYMTNRAVNNAFIRVVINESQKPRDALEQAYKEISAEITRKNREYGVIR